MHNLVEGLQALDSTSAILYLLLGALIGVGVGVVPGLSAPIVLSAILIFADHLSVTATLCLFMGALCGGFYAGSVSAILLNTPAHPEAFPITFDGYPMARKGQAGRALGLSAASTCIGGLIGCVVLAVLLPFMDHFATIFHPPEYLALVTLALLLVGALHTDSIAKTIVAGGSGLFLASIGPSSISGTYRYTFGHIELTTGMSLVAVVLGVFAVPQMLLVFGTGTAAAREDMLGHAIDAVTDVETPARGEYRRQVFGGIVESLRRWPILLQSGLVGAVTGIIPGIGAFTGNYMAYGIAKQLSRKKDEFGTGNPDGIIAPEGSSLAKEAGHIIPTIGLGIPGGVVGALFIGALSLKGMKIGEGFQDTYPGVTGQIVWIIAITGVVGTIIGLLLGSQIVKVTRLPGPLIVPFVFALCAIGPFFTETEFFPVVEMLIFSVIGVCFRRLGYPLGVFVIGLVLGPTFETNIYLTHNVYAGWSFLRERWLADVIFALVLLVIVSKVLDTRRTRRKQRLEADAAMAGNELSPTERRRRTRTEMSGRHPVLSLIVTPVLAGIGIFAALYGWHHYQFVDAAMPVVGGIAMAVPSLLVLPLEIRRFLLWRAARDGGDGGDGGDVGDSDGADRVAGIDGGGGVAALEAEVGAMNDAVLVGAGGPTVSAGHEQAPRSGRGVRGILSPGVSGAAYDLAQPIKDGSWRRNGQYRREVTAFGMLGALVLLCWLFGFMVAVPFWMACYGLFCTRRYFASWWGRVIFAAVSAAVIWTVTYEMFHLSFLYFTPQIQL